MKSKCAALLAGMLLIGTSAEAAPITYAVSLVDLPGSLTPTLAIGGSITTDGKLGILDRSDILDWDLIGAALKPLPFGNVLFNLIPSNSVFFMNDILATPLTLSVTLNPDSILMFTATASPLAGDAVKFRSFPLPSIPASWEV